MSPSAEWSFTVEGNRNIEAHWLNQDNVNHLMTLNAYGGDFGDGTALITENVVAGELVTSVMSSTPDPQYGSYIFGGWTSVPDDASTLIALDTYQRFLPSGSYVASWTAQYGDGAVIPGGEQTTESDVLTADFPDSFTLVANVATLPSRTVRFYANLDDNREATGEPLFEVEVFENSKARISSASPEEEDIDTGIVRYTAPGRDGFTFIGWTEKSDIGSGGTYYPTDATLNYYSIPEEGLGLFAAWAEGLYLIDYQGNGGTYADGDSFAKHATGKEGTIGVDANPFTRPGYTFIGWNTKVDGSGLSISADSEVTFAQLGLPDLQELDALFKTARTEDEIEAALQKGTLTLYALPSTSDTSAHLAAAVAAAMGLASLVFGRRLKR